MNDVQLNTIMKKVQQYCQTTENKELIYVEDVNENMAVCARFMEDQQWYRAIVMNDPDPAGFVEVFFVDYGNQDMVNFFSKSLRSPCIRNTNLNKTIINVCLGTLL